MSVDLTASRPLTWPQRAIAANTIFNVFHLKNIAEQLIIEHYGFGSQGIYSAIPPFTTISKQFVVVELQSSSGIGWRQM
jgi:hypothetical protein